MRCPNKECGEDHNRVVFTRESFLLPHKLRHRICLACGHRWITEEKDTGLTWGNVDGDTATMELFPEDELYVQRRERVKEEQQQRLARNIARYIKT